MNSLNFTPLDAATSEEGRRKAAEVKEEKKKWATENLKQDFEDLQVWKDLASKHSVRLPVYYAASSEIKYYRRITKKLGVDLGAFVEDTGFGSIKQFAAANKTWPAYALCGLILEWFEGLNV